MRSGMESTDAGASAGTTDKVYNQERGVCGHKIATVIPAACCKTVPQSFLGDLQTRILNTPLITEYNKKMETEGII